MAQSVKCLLCKHKAVSSDLYHPYKKLKDSTVAHTCDPSSEEVEAGRSLEPAGQPISEFHV